MTAQEWTEARTVHMTGAADGRTLCGAQTGERTDAANKVTCRACINFALKVAGGWKGATVGADAARAETIAVAVGSGGTSDAQE